MDKLQRSVAIGAAGVAIGVALASRRSIVLAFVRSSRLLSSGSGATPPKVVHVTSPDGVPSKPIDDKLTIIYWDICGLSQPLRLALALAGAGADYVDVRIDALDASSPQYKQVWFDAKDRVGKAVPFPNLPYLLDGDVGLSQSNTCLKYIGRKYGLMGDDDTLTDFVLDQATDFDGAVTGRCYRDIGSLKAWILDELPWHLEQWQTLLGGKAFLAGETCTIADAKLYETLRKLIRIEADERVLTSTMAKFPIVLEYVARFEAQPRIKAYMESSAYMAAPMNNPHAKMR